MSAPQLSYSLSGQVYAGTPVAAYTLMVKDSTGYYLPATAANRALYGRSVAMALTSYSGSLPGGVQLQHIGVVDNGLNVGAGAESWLRASATGGFEKFTPVNAGTSDIVGKSLADGTVVLQPGIWTETMAVGSGGSFVAPTGTGLVTVTGGALDGSALFVPETQILTGHWRDFNSAPWLGTVSRGPSGNRSLATGTAPTVGADFGTHPSASFNGTTQSLTGTTFAYDRYFSASGYFIQVDFQAAAASAPGGTVITDPGLCGDNQGNLYLTFSTSGVRGGHYDGAYKTTSFIACSTGAKHCAQMWHDGTTVSLRVDGGAPVTVAAGAMASQSICFPRVGANWNASVFFNGLVGRVIVANNPLTSALRDAFRADSVANFGTV